MVLMWSLHFPNSHTNTKNYTCRHFPIFRSLHVSDALINYAVFVDKKKIYIYKILNVLFVRHVFFLKELDYFLTLSC